MAKAHIHAESSAKKFGGTPNDYLDIHLLLDDSKKVLGDWRHRALTHNTWFIATILPKIFGNTRTNSDGKVYSVVDIGEQHVLEDYGMKFIPTAQDFLAELECASWMMNGKSGMPPSYPKVTPKIDRPLVNFTIPPNID
jgi:hypothetical protein